MSVEIPVLAEIVPSYVSKEEGLKRIDNAYSPIQRELKAVSDTPKDAAIRAGEAIVLASTLGLASVNPVQAADLIRPTSLSPDSIAVGQIALSAATGAAAGFAWEMIEQRGMPKKNWVEIVGSSFLGATVVAGGDFIYQSGKSIIEEKNWFDAAKFLAIPTIIGSGYLFYKTKEISRRTKEGFTNLRQGVFNNIEYKNYKSALNRIIKLSNKPGASSQEALNQMLNKYKVSLEQARSDWSELKNTKRISRFSR